jgi:hypothetical protein
MKVVRHAKQQTERSLNALTANAAMATALLTAQRTARANLEVKRVLHGRPLYWRLNANHTTTPIYDRLGDPDGRDAVLEWAREFEQGDKRILARDDIDGCLVSTIFLGLDHAFGGGPPVLFETMAFSSATKPMKLFDRERKVHEELEQRRYCTYADAMKGHAEVVAEVRKTVAHLKALREQGE